MTRAPGAALDAGERARLRVQRAVARAIFPIAVTAVGLALRGILGYRIEGQRAVRRAYRRIWRERTGPILICANHLTLIDSFLIGWALGSPALYLRHFAALPWNVPERRNFAGSHRGGLAIFFEIF